MALAVVPERIKSATKGRKGLRVINFVVPCIFKFNFFKTIDMLPLAAAITTKHRECSSI